VGAISFIVNLLLLEAGVFLCFYTPEFSHHFVEEFIIEGFGCLESHASGDTTCPMVSVLLALAPLSTSLI
jgi:hypothetical protein